MFYRRSPKSGCFYWAVTLLRIPPSICCWTLGPACLIRLPLWLPQPLLPVQFTTIRSLVTNMNCCCCTARPQSPKLLPLHGPALEPEFLLLLDLVPVNKQLLLVSPCPGSPQMPKLLHSSSLCLLGKGNNCPPT